MIMKKMYISPRMETIVITSNVIATSVGTGVEVGGGPSNTPVDDVIGDAPTRGGHRWE